MHHYILFRRDLNSVFGAHFFKNLPRISVFLNLIYNFAVFNLMKMKSCCPLFASPSPIGFEILIIAPVSQWTEECLYRNIHNILPFWDTCFGL